MLGSKQTSSLTCLKSPRRAPCRFQNVEADFTGLEVHIGMKEARREADLYVRGGGVWNASSSQQSQQQQHSIARAPHNIRVLPVPRAGPVGTGKECGMRGRKRLPRTANQPGPGLRTRGGAGSMRT